MHKLGIFGIQGKDNKYHSYKNYNGDHKENLLLEKTINKESIERYKRYFETTAYDLSINSDFNLAKRMIDKTFSKSDSLEGLIFHSDQE